LRRVTRIEGLAHRCFGWLRVGSAVIIRRMLATDTRGRHSRAHLYSGVPWLSTRESICAQPAGGETSKGRMRAAGLSASATPPGSPPSLSRASCRNRVPWPMTWNRKGRSRAATRPTTLPSSVPALAPLFRSATDPFQRLVLEVSSDQYSACQFAVCVSSGTLYAVGPRHSSDPNIYEEKAWPASLQHRSPYVW